MNKLYPDQAASETRGGIEYVRCSLCGADETELYLRAPVRPDQVGTFARDVWDIARCRRCGLIYVNPRMDSAALQTYYTFSNTTDQAFIDGWFIQNADLQQVGWLRFLRTLQRYKSTGRLLDVGCGTGTFLQVARDLGYQVVGQEVAPYFVNYCRTQLGLKILEGELESLQLEPASFDVVSAFDVIEHHPRPDRLVREMRRLLKPGGIVILSTHDIGNILARWHGVRWRYIAPIGHLTYFTRATLTRMLAQSNFQIVKQGGSHTIDESFWAEIRNYATGFLRLVLLRALILWIYLPLSQRASAMTHWRIQLRSGVLTHQKLAMRVGSQVNMNDDIVVIAKVEGER